MTYFPEIQLKGETSTNNATTTPLSSSATYTGTGDENNYTWVTVDILTDASGTLYFDFSQDGTNWNAWPFGGYVIGPNVYERHSVPKVGLHFRVRLVNGSTAQTSLTLSTYYSETGSFTNAPNNQRIGRDFDSLPVRPTDFQDEISLGLRAGINQFNKFGHRPDLDTADGEALIIADSTTNTPELLTAAETFDIAYDGTAGTSTDGSGTTGATQLTFYYIDSNGEQAIAAHNLGTDGTDTTSFSGYGINRIAVSATGSNQVNVSDITITSTTSGGVQAFVPAGQGVTQQAILYTPINARAVSKSLYVSVGKLSGGSAPRVEIKGWVWNRPIESKFEIFRTFIDTGIENTVTFTDACNFPLNPGDVLYFTASTDTNNTAIEALRFSCNIYEDV